MSKLTTEQAKQFLRDQGYFTDNLWHIDDVKQNYECDDETAQQILDSVMTNEWVVQRTFEMVDGIADELELKPKSR